MLSMAHAQFQQDAQQIGYFSGALNFRTVLSVYEVSLSYVETTANPVIDCTGLTQGDSAGIALLLACFRAAVNQRKKFQVRALPEGMRALMRVCDLEDFFESK